MTSLTVQTPMLTLVREIVRKAGKEHEFDTAHEFAMSFPKTSAWQAFSIKVWASPDVELGKRIISVTHWGVDAAGDLYKDPDAEMNDLGFPLNLTIAGVRGPIEYVSLYRSHNDGKVKINLRWKQENLSFLRTWARNLRQQGILQRIPQATYHIDQ